MADLFTKEYNTRTRFTRMCIGEALFVLLDQKEYGQIRISDIVKRAGVSRMTFYHYYDTKEEAVQDYFHEIVKEYVWEVARSKGKLGHFHFSDNDRCYPGHGHIDFKEIVDALYDIGYMEHGVGAYEYDSIPDCITSARLGLEHIKQFIR